MRSKRKDEHLKLALKQDIFDSDFERVHLFHQSLPDYDLSEVSLSTQYLENEFVTPIYINAMTGGTDKSVEVNRKLALLAKRYQLPMAVGSQHIALDNEKAEESFRVVREVNPSGFIIGNINANATIEDARRAIEMIKADALEIHINVAQELTMDEGDRHFKHWKQNIKKIVENIHVPVIVKEVGNGLSYESVSALIDLKVKYVDVSGRGGTNFIWIENQRSKEKRYDYLQTWGLSTVDALLDTQKLQDKIEILASGGVKTPLDVIKALVLGAKAVGLSGYFLKMVEENKEDEFEWFLEDLKKLMLMLNVNRIEDLKTIRKKVID